MKSASLKPTAYVLLFGASISVFSSLHVDAASPVTDLFHEGEYLSSHLYHAGGQYIFLPVLIHGKLDYVPANIAELLSGSSKSIIVYTRLINMGIVTVSSFLVFLIVDVMLKKNPGFRFGGALGVALLMLTYNAQTTSPVEIQQGAPGVRDVFLLSEIYLTCAYFTAETLALKFRVILLLTVSLSASMGFFWAYNKGLLGLLIFFMFAAGVWITSQRYLETLLLLSGFVTVLAAIYLFDRPMFFQHFANISYWAHNQEIWQYAFSWRRLIMATPFVIAVGVVFWLLCQRALGDYRSDHRSLAVLGLILAVVSVVSLIQSTNRMDNRHLSFAMPYFVIALAFLASRHAASLRKSIYGADVFEARSLAGAQFGFVFLAALIFLDHFSPNGSKVGDSIAEIRRNVSRLRHPPTRDIELFNSDELNIAKILARDNIDCTYIFDNSGVFYQLSGLPPCSRFLYPVYVAAEFQRTVLADFNEHRPAEIVYSSNKWWNAIDGRSLDDRTPEIAAWVLANYPYTMDFGSYTIRSVKPVVGLN